MGERQRSLRCHGQEGTRGNGGAEESHGVIILAPYSA